MTSTRVYRTARNRRASQCECVERRQGAGLSLEAQAGRRHNSSPRDISTAGPTPGARLGPYEIVSLLGSRRMREVYKGRDPRLRRDVAIKVLSGAFSADPERLTRFQQEARAAAALSHPNIEAVYDVGHQLQLRRPSARPPVRSSASVRGARRHAHDSVSVATSCRGTKLCRATRPPPPSTTVPPIAVPAPRVRGPRGCRSPLAPRLRRVAQRQYPSVAGHPRLSGARVGTRAAAAAHDHSPRRRVYRVTCEDISNEL
jgi:hypothetical protein